MRLGITVSDALFQIVELLPCACDVWLSKAKDGIWYYKHGIGCAVWLPSGTVDFDFGEHGEADGFNRGRIAQFAMPDLAAYGFETPEAVKAMFDQAVASGEIVCPESTVCYLAGSDRLHATDV